MRRIPLFGRDCGRRVRRQPEDEFRKIESEEGQGPRTRADFSVNIPLHAADFLLSDSAADEE